MYIVYIPNTKNTEESRGEQLDVCKTYAYEKRLTKMLAWDTQADKDVAGESIAPTETKLGGDDTVKIPPKLSYTMIVPKLYPFWMKLWSCSVLN